VGILCRTWCTAATVISIATYTREGRTHEGRAISEITHEIAEGTCTFAVSSAQKEARCVRPRVRHAWIELESFLEAAKRRGLFAQSVKANSQIVVRLGVERPGGEHEQ